MGSPDSAIAKAVRAECLWCIGRANARGAYDCLNRLCPLYPAHPFRGLHVEPRDQERADKLHQDRPRQIASRALVRAQCRHCIPEGDKLCTGNHCHLYPFTPCQPGGQPKRASSAAAQARGRQWARQTNEHKAQLAASTEGADEPASPAGSADQLTLFTVPAIGQELLLVECRPQTPRQTAPVARAVADPCQAHSPQAAVSRPHKQ